MTIVAEDVVVKIRADMADLETKMNRAAVVTTNTTRTIERSAGAAAAATRNLGRQWADVGSSLASGSSPFLVLAQQAPQVADALADTGGKAAKVAAFFAGPWGAALLAAGSVLGVLVGKLLETDPAAAKAEAKLRAASIGADGLGDATLNAAAAVRVLNQAQLNDRSGELAGDVIALANARLKQAQATFQAAKSESALRLAQGQARLADLEDGTVRNANGRGVRQLDTHVTRAGSELSRERLLASNQIRDATKELQQLDAAYAKAIGSIRKGALSADGTLADTKLRLAGATTALERAQIKAGAVQRQAEIEFKTGSISIGEYGRRVRSAAGAVESLQASTKGDVAAKRDAARATREAEKAARDQEKTQRDLEQSLERILGKYDPVTAAAKETGQALKDIDKLEMEGIISAADALGLKLKVAADQARKVSDLAWKEQEGRWLSAGLTPGDFDGSNVRKTIDDGLAKREDDRTAAAETAIATQEAQVRSLATIYEDAFRGGTRAIWADFRELGFRILAEMLARWTVMKLSGAGGDSSVGSLFSAASKSVLGFASGGYTGAGPRNQVAGVVHKGEYVMPAKAVDRIGVSSLTALASGSGVRPVASVMPNLSGLPREAVAVRPTQIVVHVQANDYFDAKVKNVSAGVAAQVAAPIADAYATRRSATMGEQVLKAVPSRLARFQNDGI